MSLHEFTQSDTSDSIATGKQGSTQVKQCNESFRHRNDLKRHAEENHGGKAFECGKCADRFESRDGLKDHTKAAHPKSSFYKKDKQMKWKRVDGKYECPVCETLVLRKWMQHHLNSEHGDGSGHLCPTCGKECVTANELRDHLRQHPMRNSVECKHCDKTFKRQHDFDDHLVAGKCPKTSLRCQSCGATFKQEQKLREHTALCDRHRGFQCEFCSRSFKKIKHLQEHQKEQHKLPKDWKIPKEDVFIHNIAEEIRVMAQQKLGGTTIFNHHKPPSSDPFLQELSRSAIASAAVSAIDVPFAYGKQLEIFNTSKPTHDKAAVIEFFEGDGSFAPRLHSTGNELPMHGPKREKHDVPELKGRGTRHKAAYYGSLHCDALIVVVSEEKGSISTFLNGHVECGVSPDRLEEMLREMVQ
ncbi:hypothetical protein AAVH_12950 [Aphelenchoides avenae]|nr:hypothetical protein AAVH_12950 [Aphelenchus avenae]